MFQNIKLKVNYSTNTALYSQGLPLWAKQHVQVPSVTLPKPMFTPSIIQSLKPLAGNVSWFMQSTHMYYRTIVTYKETVYKCSKTEQRKIF